MSAEEKLERAKNMIMRIFNLDDISFVYVDGLLCGFEMTKNIGDIKSKNSSKTGKLPLSQ